MTIRYGREMLAPRAGRGLEYLMAGDQSYCSSSVYGNTRKYHGLLVHRGTVYLSALDEQVNGVWVSGLQYEGTPHDSGPGNCFSFSLYPPSWVFWIDDVIVKKTITFNGGPTITYDITGEADIFIRPLIANRSVNQVIRNPHVEFEHDGNCVRWCGSVLDGDFPFTPAPETYWNVWYERERERGYEPVEDLISPGFFSRHVSNGQVSLRCFREDQAIVLEKETPALHSFQEWLDRAADTFCHGDEIYAGYHWFTESWGRDSAISVTGLLIDRGNKKGAQQVLRRLADKMTGGVIPNRFPDNYHTSDASLWFIHALSRYQRRWGDDGFILSMVPVVAEVLAQYPASPVAQLDHSLISVAPRSTWMDTTFTPREGKPVEINALWVHALTWAETLGITPPVPVESAVSAFKKFWNEDSLCLYDRIDPVDPSLRPNQVIALALGLVDRDQASAALATVSKSLLTPYGLRTLSPHDPRYIGHFNGDGSYHNGCVWPWLTGWFTEALIRNGMHRSKIAPMLAPVLSHIREAGAGYISEIFDGDFPYSPGGCIAQAWSVAEISRACRMVFLPRETKDG